MNDLEIAVIGVPFVDADKMVWLQSAPVDRRANLDLVAVGTGFGRAFLIPPLQSNAPMRAFATESGHASWAARNTIERRLAHYVALRHDLPCVEHLLCGRGLHLLYDFIISEGLAPATAQLEIERAEDPSAVIGKLGVKDLDDGCAAAVALFVDILGSELGNTALRSIPRGGLYIWGGVARKLRPALERGELIDAFLDKHRMRELLATIPLALIDEGNLALLGAKHAALSMLPYR